MSEQKLKIQDIYKDAEDMAQEDWLIQLLNQPPPEAWVKTHPYIKNYRYLPIDKTEYLLKKIFKRYRIEVISVIQMFNGVVVVVRVHYLHPITGEWEYHDGAGGEALQVTKGASAADLGAINNGALKMAVPIAKTVAIKDACDHFGRLFGSDLNRKDQINYEVDEKLQEKARSAVDKVNSQVDQAKAPVVQNTPLATLKTPNPPSPPVDGNDWNNF